MVFTWLPLRGVQRVPNEFSELKYAPSVRLELQAVTGLFLEGTPPKVALDRRHLKSGERTISFEEINTARVDSSVLRAGTLHLIFGVRDSFEFGVVLRKNSEVVVSERTQQLLAQVLAESSIGIPTDRYDPKGKFARSGAPYNVTREEATELVLHPPLKGEPLPITP